MHPDELSEINEIKKKGLRLIPSVYSILSHELIRRRFGQYPRSVLVEGIRNVLDQKRKWILSQDKVETWPGDKISIDLILDEVAQYIQASRSLALTRVINGTGIILHTNLGRAIVSERVIKQLSIIAGHYSNLEFDLTTGKRGYRGEYIGKLLQQLTGATDSLVVNNNAAAVFLIINTLAKSRQVIVSRGELVEIGGSFRIPEIITEAGARLVEVGTTNKTRIEDYQRAISPETAAILKVHPSNYRIIGFTEEVELRELVSLGNNSGLPVIYDLGSGGLMDLTPYRLKEPVVSQVVQQGPDIISFSGDKLLGGPQAGIILCRKKYAGALRKNPLNRVIRPDKMTLACLEYTLKIYQEYQTQPMSQTYQMSPKNQAGQMSQKNQKPEVVKEIPVLRMITDSISSLEARGKKIIDHLSDLKGQNLRLNLIEDTAEVGGGALCLQPIPSLSIVICGGCTCSGLNLPGSPSIEQLAENLRRQDPPIIGRIYEDQFRLNLRTVLDEDLEDLIKGVRQGLTNWRSFSL